ncbi:hypothetical+protein [Methylocapsa aurea]|uniref:hypothetical protein n=1 Tax=Methylocapsa aurea TaxID=663610 RepID=UPI003D18E799
MLADGLKGLEIGAAIAFQFSAVLVMLAMPVPRPRISLRVVQLSLSFVAATLMLHLSWDVFVLLFRYWGWIG